MNMIYCPDYKITYQLTRFFCFNEHTNQHTVGCRYNAINFLQNPHNRHPIARTWGRAMRCLLWLQIQTRYVSVFAVIHTTLFYVWPPYNGTWRVVMHPTLDITVLLGYYHQNLKSPLRWRHNGHDSVSNHQPHDCLFNRLFRRRSKKTSKLGVTGLCTGNAPETGEFLAQMASNAENVSVWWRHHVTSIYHILTSAWRRMWEVYRVFVMYFAPQIEQRNFPSPCAIWRCA